MFCFGPQRPQPLLLRLLGGVGAPSTDAYAADGHKLQCASEAAANSTVYLADAGRPWQWAPEWPGHERRVLLPGEARELTLRTLGVEPTLFRVRGLLTPQEAAALYAAAEPTLQPSQVRSPDQTSVPVLTSAK